MGSVCHPKIKRLQRVRTISTITVLVLLLNHIKYWVRTSPATNISCESITPPRHSANLGLRICIGLGMDKFFNVLVIQFNTHKTKI